VFGLQPQSQPLHLVLRLRPPDFILFLSAVGPIFNLSPNVFFVSAIIWFSRAGREYEEEYTV